MNGLVGGMLLVLIIMMVPIQILIPKMWMRIIVVILIALVLFAIPGQTTAILALMFIGTEAIIDIIKFKINAYRNRDTAEEHNVV